MQAFLTAAVTNTPIAAGSFDPSKIQVKVYLKRGRHQIQICNDNLKVLATDSALGNALIGFVAPGVNSTSIVTVAAAVGVDEQQMLPFKVDFGGVIDLQGGDELELTVTSQGNEYDATIDSTVSFVNFDFLDSCGVEKGIPVITCISVNTGDSNNTFDGGNGVTRIAFINLDKTDRLAASQVLQNVAISSDKLNLSLQYNSLQTYFAGISDGFDYADCGQSMVLYDAKRRSKYLNQTTVTASFTPANVNAGQCYMVVRSKKFLPDSERRFAERQSIDITLDKRSMAGA